MQHFRLIRSKEPRGWIGFSRGLACYSYVASSVAPLLNLLLQPQVQPCCVCVAPLAPLCCSPSVAAPSAAVLRPCSTPFCTPLMQPRCSLAGPQLQPLLHPSCSHCCAPRAAPSAATVALLLQPCCSLGTACSVLAGMKSPSCCNFFFKDVQFLSFSFCYTTDKSFAIGILLFGI